jgi:hypothetical protein
MPLLKERNVPYEKNAYRHFDPALPGRIRQLWLLTPCIQDASASPPTNSILDSQHCYTAPDHAYLD